MFLLFIGMAFVGLAGTLAFYDQWAGYVFGHVGGLGILGLFGCWAGFIAKKKGYNYWRAFSVCFVSSFMLGVVSVCIVHGSGGNGCGGIVSIAVAVIVIVFYYFIKRKAAGDQAKSSAGP